MSDVGSNTFLGVLAILQETLISPVIGLPCTAYTTSVFSAEGTKSSWLAMAGSSSVQEYCFASKAVPLLA